MNFGIVEDICFVQLGVLFFGHHGYWMGLYAVIRANLDRRRPEFSFFNVRHRSSKFLFHLRSITELEELFRNSVLDQMDLVNSLLVQKLLNYAPDQPYWKIDSYIVAAV